MHKSNGISGNRLGVEQTDSVGLLRVAKAMSALASQIAPKDGEEKTQRTVSRRRMIGDEAWRREGRGRERGKSSPTLSP